VGHVLPKIVIEGVGGSDHPRQLPLVLLVQSKLSHCIQCRNAEKKQTTVPECTLNAEMTIYHVSQFGAIQQIGRILSD